MYFLKFSPIFVVFSLSVLSPAACTSPINGISTCNIIAQSKCMVPYLIGSTYELKGRGNEMRTTLRTRTFLLCRFTTKSNENTGHAPVALVINEVRAILPENSMLQGYLASHSLKIQWSSGDRDSARAGRRRACSRAGF